MPTDARVDDIFLPMMPYLPIPEITTFPFLQFIIVLTALLKELLILNFNFFKDFISASITSLAIGIKFFFFINETKHLL